MHVNSESMPCNYCEYRTFRLQNKLSEYFAFIKFIAVYVYNLIDAAIVAASPVSRRDKHCICIIVSVSLSHILLLLVECNDA